MPKPGTTNERAALEATRSRLEVALRADANWQALQRSLKQASADDGAPVHDARLELLLLGNPLFRAWKEADDAIEDLRRSETGAGPSDAPARLIPIPALAGSTAAKQIASLADLSHGIARLIERSLPAGGRAAAPLRLEIPADVPAEPPPVEAPTVVEPPQVIETPQVIELHAVADAADEVRPESPAPAARQPAAIAANRPDEPPPPPKADPAPTAPALASEPIKLRSPAAARAWPRSGPEPDAREPADPPSFRHELEPEEATVTFVMREPVTPRSSRPERTHAPFGWSSARAAEPVDTEHKFDIAHAPNDDIEEAEVTILTADDLKEQQETAQRDGNLRRFRKALLGD